MGVYGPRTIYCIALKDAPGTHEFLLQDDGKWVHVKETTEIGQCHCLTYTVYVVCLGCGGCSMSSNHQNPDLPALPNRAMLLVP